MHTGMAASDNAELGRRMRALGASSLFSALPETAVKTLAAAMTERQVECGAKIFLQSDPGTALYAVLAGQVRIVVGGADGREHVLRIAGPGEVFGEISVLDSQPRTADAVAATRCRLLVLERRSLLALMAEQPAIALNLIGVLCEKLRATSAQVESLLFQGLPQRLANVLLDLVAARRGNTIDITQSELGQLTGVTREWVNKKLRAWQAAGLVALQPGRVAVLQPDLLRNFVRGTGEAGDGRRQDRERKNVLF
jgi:CRP-like cAMP-binding protein